MNLYEFAKTIGATVTISAEFDPKTSEGWANAYLKKNYHTCNSHTGWSLFGRSHTGSIDGALQALVDDLVDEGEIYFDDRNVLFTVPEDLTVETAEPFTLELCEVK